MKKFWAADSECSQERADDDAGFDSVVVMRVEVNKIVFVCRFSIYAEEEVGTGIVQEDVQERERFV